MKKLVLLAVITALGAFAAPAAAKPGWELPQVSSFVNGDPNLPNTNYARHCGKSPFGNYKFVIGVTANGRHGAVRFKVKITQDGKLHDPKKIRFSGKIPKQLKRKTARLLHRVGFRYNPGPPEKVETVFRGGQVQASRPWNPKPRNCK